MSKTMIVSIGSGLEINDTFQNYYENRDKSTLEMLEQGKKEIYDSKNHNELVGVYPRPFDTEFKDGDTCYYIVFQEAGKEVEIDGIAVIEITIGVIGKQDVSSLESEHSFSWLSKVKKDMPYLFYKKSKEFPSSYTEMLDNKCEIYEAYLIMKETGELDNYINQPVNTTGYMSNDELN